MSGRPAGQQREQQAAGVVAAAAVTGSRTAHAGTCRWRVLGPTLVQAAPSQHALCCVGGCASHQAAACMCGACAHRPTASRRPACRAPPCACVWRHGAVCAATQHPASSKRGGMQFRQAAASAAACAVAPVAQVHVHTQARVPLRRARSWHHGRQARHWRACSEQCARHSACVLHAVDVRAVTSMSDHAGAHAAWWWCAVDGSPAHASTVWCADTGSRHVF